ncbi:MAG: NADH-quinone oxidoreductase subunit C [Candidatus Omnitrophota bacterium]
MNRLITRNNRVVSRTDIPCLSISLFRDEVIHASKQGMRVVSFFGMSDETNRSGDIFLYAILAGDEQSVLTITSTRLEKHSSYPSLTLECPPFHIFEREFYDEFGIRPDGHPWLKPVRYDYRRQDLSQTMAGYPFFQMTGDEVHEVAVGPVHAGIIEPGHFRFMCHGERVHHLEIQLGYQHRGVEALFEEKGTPGHSPFKVRLAESLAGDSVIAHATAYAQAIESLGNIDISLRAAAIRAIALELERIAVHIGDLGAIANDIAYLTGNAIFSALRTLVINTSLALCGSRFGRGLLCIGGVRFDIEPALRDKMKDTLQKVLTDILLMGEAMLSSPNVLARLEKAGMVNTTRANDIGMVGMAARASGLSLDIRADHPFGIYKSVPVHKFTLDEGDVFARTYMRYIEIQKSVAFIMELLDNLPEGERITPLTHTPGPDGLVVSMTEGWRGEVVHVAMTDSEGRIERYKIKDPSFNNWFGLALAVRENGVSDFPLVNKSFNLSYCGNDL